MRNILIFLSLQFSFLATNAFAISIETIEAKNVRRFLISQLTTAEIRSLAETPGNEIYNLIEKVAKYPLFVFNSPEHPAARLNFTSYFRLFALRPGTYTDNAMADLYVLHELTHIGTMPYERPITFRRWEEKMTQNEKDASFLTEILIHFMIPGIREKLKIKTIWVDRLIRNELRLHPTLTNQEFYAQSPKQFAEAAFQQYRSIRGKALYEIDDQEQRSWIFDRSNDVWAQIYWRISSDVENHMKNFYSRVQARPEAVSKEHVKWLAANTDENDLVFPREALEFHSLYHSFPQPFTEAATNLRNETLLCKECQKAQEKMDALASDGKIEVTPALKPARELLGLGVSGTVYSLPFKETAAVTQELWQSTDFSEIYGEAYTRKQDSEHKDFISTYRNWSAPVLQGLDGFAHAYPTHGSSEAIKDTLGFLRGQNSNITIHVFEGEYEGVIAYAQGLNIQLVKHPRNHETLAKLTEVTKPGDIFYLSQPSALDGNVWAQYDVFMKASEKAGLKVLIDLAYVGAVANNYRINLTYPNIEAVFFSLSKSFGVYYQRIGGVFTRNFHPMVYGNMWFKNLMSLRVGTELMKRYDVYHLPRAYKWTQIAAVNHLKKTLGVDVQPSDAILLANIPTSKNSPLASGNYSILYRGGEKGHTRFCLTPYMSILAKLAEGKSCEENLRSTK